MSYKNLTPHQIVRELDKHIVGQDKAKKSLAIALRGRWRVRHADKMICEEITPANIMMIGPTGTGKTECARRVAKLDNSPFVKVEATKYTERGYVGGDVESMVRSLAEVAFDIVKREAEKKVEPEAQIAAENIILDALIPPLPLNEGAGDKDHDRLRNEQTREKFRIKIRNGELNERKIDIEVPQDNMPSIGFMGDGMLDERAAMGIQKMMERFIPQSTQKRRVTIKQAKVILTDQQKSLLADHDSLQEEARTRAEEQGIIFIDEIDKIADSQHQAKGGDVSREGVQRDLLPIIEGATINTKYGPINTEGILFIAAGAFHQTKPADLIPEFQGRFPIRVELEPLTIQDLLHILQEPKNAITKQYKALFASEGVTLTFEEKAIKEMAEAAFTVNQEQENIGARRLHTILSHLCTPYLYDVPEQIKKGEKISITAKYVKDKLMELSTTKDMNQYIL